MAIQSSNPYVDANGFAYPFYMVNVIGSPKIAADRKDLEAQVVLNLIPYRVLDDGTHLMAMDATGRPIVRSVGFADAYEAAKYDAALAQCFGGILYLIGQFVVAKGL
jgi:hypothetical protein